MNWVEEVCISFRALSANQELAYLCVTAKPEAAIRDKLTWILQTRHPDLYIYREYTSSSEETEKSKRLDFAIYNPKEKSSLVAFETKAMLIRDLYWGLQEHQKGKWLHGTFAGIRADIENAKLACPTDSCAFGLLFLWQVYSEGKQAAEILKMDGYLKYSGEHAESIRRGEDLSYSGDLARALEIAKLHKIAVEEINAVAPHGLIVKVVMAVFDLKEGDSNGGSNEKT